MHCFVLLSSSLSLSIITLYLASSLCILGFSVRIWVHSFECVVFLYQILPVDSVRLISALIKFLDYSLLMSHYFLKGNYVLGLFWESGVGLCFRRKTLWRLQTFSLNLIPLLLTLDVQLFLWLSRLQRSLLCNFLLDCIALEGRALES